jgi:hypothetical protein
LISALGPLLSFSLLAAAIWKQTARVLIGVVGASTLLVEAIMGSFEHLVAKRCDRVYWRQFLVSVGG